MSFRFRRLRHFFHNLPQIYRGTSYRISGAGVDVLSARTAYFSCNMNTTVNRGLKLLTCQGKMYSTVAETKHEQLSAVDILLSIQSSLHESEGPSLCWINKLADSEKLLKEDGIYLVLISEYHQDFLTSDQNLIKMFEKVKFLQQRYPFLQVFAVQYSRSICLNLISTHLLWKIIKEFITFPLLLTNKESLEMENGPCYIISKGLQDPLVYREKDVDLKLLDKASHDLNAQNSKGTTIQDLHGTWAKPIQAVKEPDICYASRNLLFSFPGCISVDENGNRLFLSDINHHRIIIFNSNGRILDVIGSSPGFEDGEFETAKLMRPAASFYYDHDNCLYFVDSENHAIRRADMEGRVVETVFPVTDANKKNTSLWNWITDKIWTKRNIKLKSDELSSESLLFPWHLLKSPDNDLFVLNQSFGTLWIIDLESGCIKDVVKESSKILEICGQMILEKSIPLREMPGDWLQHQVDNNCLVEGVPYADLMSSVATFKGHVVFCDTVGQMVLKFNKGSSSPTSFQFSNFGILGLPYWLSSPLERVYAVDDVLSGIDVDHLQQFRLFPGKVDIEINIDIPQTTELVELPQEDCIWRQARGAAAEVSGVDNKAALTEKVGISQKWYDEIDNLNFSVEEVETVVEEESRPTGDQVLENKVCIDCTINTSPGTSEVIIYAALYLRLKKNTSFLIDCQEKKAAMIADILDPKKRFNRDHLIKLLTKANRDLEELIFMKPLHVRLKFNSHNHPKADNSKDIILTDSSLKVHVIL